jgi:hypothetical protein
MFTEFLCKTFMLPNFRPIRGDWRSIWRKRMRKEPTEPTSLRFATKHGAHEARGKFAVAVLALMVVIPIVLVALQ